MKKKVFTIRENFRFDDIELRKKIIRENIIKIIENRFEKEAVGIYNHSHI